MNITKLKEILRENGIVGAGGAGFPTYAKLDMRADTLILNCAECEPLLKLHRQVLENNALEILSTLDQISKILEVSDVYIGIKASYTSAVNAVKAQIASFPNIKICSLPEVYPAGDEVVLTYEATKRVVPAGEIPLSVGVTVLNVETVYNVYRAINEDKPVTHKYVTVVGEVKNPITVLAPIGITVDKLIEAAGGVTTDDPAYLLGGPMMGRLGTPADTITKTSNAILVLPKNAPLIRRKLSKASISLKRAMSSCCQCNYCTTLCPRNLLGHPIDPSAFMLAASNGDAKNVKPFINTMYCSGCGLCESFSCVQGLSPRTLIGATKNGLRANGFKATEKPEMKAVDQNRNLRMVPVSRLRARLGLNKYNCAAPLIDFDFKFKQLNISLSQHIGAPAVPVVKKGDSVVEGQMIAAPAENMLSVGIHSPISGTVTLVTGKNIIIKA